MKVNLRMIEKSGIAEGDKSPSVTVIEDIALIESTLERLCSGTNVEIQIGIPLEEKTGLFCDCCGLSVARIIEKLESCEWKKLNEYSQILVRCDGLHFQYSNQKGDELKDFYTKRNVLSFCEFCGVLLQEKDIYSAWEYMGECHGRPERQCITSGYKCHYCGAEELY